jgi:menaquinone-specific isochorismate synthase
VKQPLVARTVVCDDDIDPHAWADRPGSIVWARGERALVAWGRVARIEPGSGDGRFERASYRVRSLLETMEVEDGVGAWGSGPIAFGAFAFDPDSPRSAVVVPEVIVGRDAGTSWITTISRSRPPERPGPPRPRSQARRARAERSGSSVSEPRWMEAVADARAAVRDGIIDKVVLARDAFVTSTEPIHAARLAERLAARYPECYALRFEEMVGATPELLVRRRASEVSSMVLGGSAPPGGGDRLLASGKDRREHELAVTTVRDGLARACSDVRADDEPGVFRLPYVEHLSGAVVRRPSSSPALCTPPRRCAESPSTRRSRRSGSSRPSIAGATAGRSAGSMRAATGNGASPSDARSSTASARASSPAPG